MKNQSRFKVGDLVKYLPKFDITPHMMIIESLNSRTSSSLKPNSAHNAIWIFGSYRKFGRNFIVLDSELEKVEKNEKLID